MTAFGDWLARAISLPPLIQWFWRETALGSADNEPLNLTYFCKDKDYAIPPWYWSLIEIKKPPIIHDGNGIDRKATGVWETTKLRMERETRVSSTQKTWFPERSFSRHANIISTVMAMTKHPLESTASLGNPAVPTKRTREHHAEFPLRRYMDRGRGKEGISKGSDGSIIERVLLAARAENYLFSWICCHIHQLAVNSYTIISTNRSTVVKTLTLPHETQATDRYNATRIREA